MAGRFLDFFDRTIDQINLSVQFSLFWCNEAYELDLIRWTQFILILLWPKYPRSIWSEGNTVDDVYLDFDRLRLLFVGSKVHFSVHTYNTALNSTTVFHKWRPFASTKKGESQDSAKKNQRRPRTQKKPPYALNFIHRSNGDNHEKARRSLIPRCNWARLSCLSCWTTRLSRSS